MTASNNGGYATTVIKVIILDKPGPPIGPVVFTDVTSNSMKVAWNPPTVTGGCPISNYTVEKRESTSTVWSTVSATCARTTLKIQRLTKGTEYMFRIRAENRFGAGQTLSSDYVVAKHSYSAPGPPGQPECVAVTKHSVSLVWNEPVKDGGVAIMGYHIEHKDRNSILWQVL